MGKLKHIAIFLPSLAGGGAERVALVLAGQFSQVGIRVDIVLAHYQGEYLAQARKTVNIIDLQASRMISSVPKLTSYLQTHKPDVLLSTIDLANITAFLAVTLSPYKPLWVMRQASYPAHDQNKKSVYVSLLGLLYRKALAATGHVIAISKGLGHFLQNKFQVPPEKISVIYNPAFTLDPNIAAKTADLDWFDEGKSVITTAGRLNKVKDFPTLIRAFHTVHQHHPEARLLILGDGTERDNLTQLISALELEEMVLLPGFVPDPTQYMKRSRIFVLSSISEGFGNVLVEAMACGCPVVSTDCPSGPREILKDGEYGHLVPVGDAAAMAAAILDVLDGHRKYAPSHWLDQFKPEVIAREYLQVFEQLISTISDNKLG
jgi:glycosyltransferase involved in cell wall biosynthesis